MTEPGNTYSWSHSSAVYQIANGEDGDRTDSAVDYFQTVLGKASEEDSSELGALLLAALLAKRNEATEPLTVHIALCDGDTDEDPSNLLGAFRTPEKAQEACQVDADFEAEIFGDIRPLSWEDGNTQAGSGDMYRIVQVEVDKRIS